MQRFSFKRIKADKRQRRLIQIKKCLTCESWADLVIVLLTMQWKKQLRCVYSCQYYWMKCKEIEFQNLLGLRYGEIQPKSIPMFIISIYDSHLHFQALMYLLGLCYLIHIFLSQKLIFCGPAGNEDSFSSLKKQKEHNSNYLNKSPS